MIALSNISKVYNDGMNNRVHAVRNTNFHINKGEFLVLIGANGSGKSTLLNIVAGSIKTSSGKVFYNEHDVTAWEAHRRAKFIARLFQNPLHGTAPHLSVIDNFRLASLRSKSKTFKIGTGTRFRNKVKENIEFLKLNLENKLDQKMGSLSGGQRQALTLAMAVMDEAEIILLDEPTAALDPRASGLLLEKADSIIRTFSLSAIMVTHKLKDAIRYGNRLIYMAEGEVKKDLNQNQKGQLSLTQVQEWFA